MLVTLKDIKKIIGGNILFSELNFEIKPGEKIGMVGRNGEGKSTIFKIITRLEEFEQGELFIKKDTKIGYLEQIPLFNQGTVWEFLEASFDKLNQLKQQMVELEKQMQDTNKIDKVLASYGEVQAMFASQGGYEMEANIKRIAAGLNIDVLLDQSFDHLSGGEKTKAGLARILLQEPDLLLLDEPTNHLDLSAIQWLENFLAQYAGAVCIISHDRYFLDHTIKKVADLECGEVTYYQGNYSSYVEQKETKLLQEFAAYQEQQKKIKKIKEAIKRLRQWANEANPPNEKLFKRAKSMERALERMEKLDKPVLDPKKMNLDFNPENRSGEDVIKCKALYKDFDNKQVLKGIDLHLRYQERLAIVGDNGSGKSTLIKLILGKESATAGEVLLGSQIKIGYLPQHPLQDVDPKVSVIDYFREEVRATEGQARHLLAQFMFYGYSVFQKISQLSGGERMRVQLAIFMHQGVNVLVLDEPTNHLDIDSQEVLEEAIANFEGTVIGISHDRYFLNQCFTDTAYLVDGSLKRYPGTYQETCSNWEQLKQQVQEKQQKQAPKKAKEIKKTTSIDYEVEISRLEAKVADLEKKNPSNDKIMQFRQKIDHYYNVWLEKEEKKIDE
ncbi:ribosomal protection-like ABC-F family protein [Radiobacillus sp. PE A8.2]|uniref:ribosomal protection-like ABC-F family protein n=1 Tax=Radiobacillus sp. PE A8.2 TaxID=3380349 RepID=UPI00388E824F